MKNHIRMFLIALGHKFGVNLTFTFDYPLPKKIQIQILEIAKENLCAAFKVDHDDYHYVEGLCAYIRNAISSQGLYTPFMSLDKAIPVFTYENAIEYGNATGTRKNDYWWDYSYGKLPEIYNYKDRIKFLDWMIDTLKK